MRKNTIVWLIGLAICLQSGAFGAEWERQSPIPLGNELNDVHVFDLDTTSVLAVGNGGAFIRSTDRGITWDNQTPLNGSDNDLFSIFFVDDSTGWIVGEIGTVLKTGDCGATWTALPNAIEDDLDDVFFTDRLNGWSVGRWGSIYRSENGGEDWTPQSSGTVRRLKSVFFVNPDTGWVVGHGGAILKTTDGGAAWTAQESGTDSHLRSVFFFDPDTGWAAGEDSTLLKTTDGGNRWSPRNSGTGLDFSAIHFTDPDTGFVAGFRGSLDDLGGLRKSGGGIIRTSDGGETWSPVLSDPAAGLNAVRFSAVGTGWSVGTTGCLLETEDLGTTWTPRSRGASGTLSAVFFTDPERGWAIASGTLYRTTDGGDTWTANPEPVLDDPRLADFSFTSLQFADADTGLLTGSYIIQSQVAFEMASVVLRTTDGGDTWNTARRQEFEYILDLQMLDADTGFALAAVIDLTNGSIQSKCLSTTNGGLAWTALEGRISTSVLYSLDFTDSKTGWAAGESGMIYRTLDGGLTWKGFRTGMNNVFFQEVDFADSRRGWAVGANGLIVATENGGEKWKRLDTGTSEFITSLFAVDGGTVWAAGTGGTILNTLDGGLTWERQQTGCSDTFLDAFFPTVGTGYVVGDNGSIFKTTGGTTDVSRRREAASAGPFGFRLEPNYPNPFNPETTFRFSLPKEGEITLRIFDLLGREVAVPASGRYGAGEHRVLFHADGLASGVYFCRLQAGDRIRTRKIVIQK
jgi:photosystem II stability/assembly factor-like uncharacterized protein